MATTQEVGEVPAKREDSLGWRLRGGGGTGEAREARRSGAGQGSSERPRAGRLRLAAPPRANAVRFRPRRPGRRNLRAESSGEEEGAGGRVRGNPCHLPPSRTRYLLHRLGSSREGSAPLGRCAVFLRAPLRAPAFRGRSPESPGSLGFPSSQLHVQGYGSC